MTQEENMRSCTLSSFPLEDIQEQFWGVCPFCAFKVQEIKEKQLAGQACKIEWMEAKVK